MFTTKVLFSVLSYASLVLSQLALPQPPWLPPNSSQGAIPSSGGSPNPQWSSLLGNLLYFYDAQRSGKLPSTNRVEWRNDSAVNDGQDTGHDLSGGYYDAGDYVKFTYPLSFTLMSVCWGALDYGQGYDKANQTVYLDDTLRWGLDWMMKAHPNNRTLFVQVGDSNTDNAYWGGDRGLPTPRPAYQINDTHPGTDSAASAAAAFSACSLLYNSSKNTTSGLQPASLQNSSYASVLLSHAVSLHDFAANSPNGRVLTQISVPAVKDAYSSSGWEDDFVLSTLFLAWASNSTTQYQQAESDYGLFKLGGKDDVFNWDDRTPALAVLFSQILHVAPSLASTAKKAMSDWQSEAESYFDRILNGYGRGQLTGGGLLYYPGDSDPNSLNPALNAAMLMTRYSALTSNQNKRATYIAYAKGQVDYVLGKNPMSAPYVVGVNPNSPQNPHSAPSSGGSDIANIDTSPKVAAYVLYGAVVGGPDRSGRFWDLRSDWIQSEVALDYNAPLLTLAAYHVMNDTSDPYYTQLKEGEYEARRPQGRPCDVSQDCSHGSTSTKLPRAGQIALGVIISVVGLVIVGLLAYWAVIELRGSPGKG